MNTESFLQISLSGIDNKKTLLRTQIDAYNKFILTIPSVIYDHFTQKKEIKLENSTSGFRTFNYEFSFSNIRFEKKYDNYENQCIPIYPNQCITERKTYAIRMISNIKTKQYYTKNDGSTHNVIEQTLQNVLLGNIPCMVGSNYCHLNGMDITAKKLIKEDPYDFGGYFIIDGSQKAIIATKNVIKNSPQYYVQNKDGILVRCDLTSQNGDNFEPSYYMVIKLLAGKGITIDIAIGKDATLVIPFYILYYAYNIGSQKNIFDTILPNYNSQDSTEYKISVLFNEAMKFNYLKINKNSENNYIHLYYENGELKNSSASIIIALAEAIDSINIGATAEKFVVGEKKTQLSVDEKKSIIDAVLQKLDLLILPHIGITSKDRMEKLKFLGSLLRGVYGVYLGDNESNRNSFCNQVINDTQLAEVISFKTLFNMTVATKIVNEMQNKQVNKSNYNFNLVNTINGVLSNPDLGTALCKALKAGNKTIIKINKRPTTNRVITNTLDNMNEASKLNSLRLLQNIRTIGGKTNSAQINSRNSHPTDISCRLQSAEGKRAGQTTAFTLSTQISGLSYSKKIEDFIMTFNIENIDKINIKNSQYSRIILNGRPLGSHSDTYLLTNKLRELRRNGEINRDTSIIYKPFLRGELEINSQKGRALRLFVIVYNNEQNFIAGKDKEFKQWINYTDQHAKDLQAKKITVENLMNEKIVELISSLEYCNIFVAQSYEYFSENANNPLKPFTHVDLPHSNFSINIMASPFINHSECVRTTYEGNQVKQALGIPMLNYASVYVNKFYLPLYYFEPIAKTIYNRILRSNGASITILIKSSCNNQEDSAIISESLAFRNKFSVLVYLSTSYELSNEQVFDTPNVSEIRDLKANTYSHLIKGVPKRGTIIKKGMPIIGVIDTKAKKDNSIIYKKNSPTIIDGAKFFNKGGFKVLVVKSHTYRPIEPGDKGSSRSGNKNIISRIEYDERMPISASGLVPDMIINPHSFPSRMVFNQIMESIVSKLCCHFGYTCDVSIFRTVDQKQIKSVLESVGINYSGDEIFYDDVTGQKIKGEAFICPSYYQRLAKMIKDNSTAVDKPALDIRTQQKTKGINNGGGSRFGEMEKVVGLVIGSMSMVDSKMFKDCDGKTAYICNNCGNFANVNPSHLLYSCKTCINDPNVTFSELPSSFGTFNFIKLLNIVGINVKMHTEKPTYLIQQ
jgi:DNA-directed RNA polymerase beta subunit